jgi:THO complex subunit 4
MSGKLDQSLDEILSTQRRSAVRGKGGRRGRRVPQAGRTTAVAAPVGGVKKTPKQAKGAVKAIPTGPSGGPSDSKIQVSNLVSTVRALDVEHANYISA